MLNSWKNRKKDSNYKPLSGQNPDTGIKLVILGGNHSYGDAENVGLAILKECQKNQIPVVTLSESAFRLDEQIAHAQGTRNVSNLNYLRYIQQHALKFIGVNIAPQKDRSLRKQDATLVLVLGENKRTNSMANTITELIKKLPEKNGVLLLPIGAIHADRVAEKVRKALPESIKDSVQIIVTYCPNGYFDKWAMEQQIEQHTEAVGDKVTMTKRFIYAAEASTFATEVLRPGNFEDQKEADQSICGRLAKKCVIL